MFDSNKSKYMTRGIAQTLHIEIQILLWRLIDFQKEQGVELDYLQAFELIAGDHNNQHVIHRQEVPELETKRFIPLKETIPINSTVWCIDDGNQAITMLFPNEY